MNDKISRNLNSLEKRIISVVETWEKKERQKENLLKELETYKKKFNEEVTIEHENLLRKINLLQKEREEIKQRVKSLLTEISNENSKSLHIENG